jgi:hypothetical protein
MAAEYEYHISMRPSVSASILGTILLLIPLAFVASSPAQINAPPSSVTSPGFGGRPLKGAPSSVTSIGPRGYSPGYRTGTPGTVPYMHPRGNGNGEHRRHRDNDYLSYPYNYSYPYYYAVPVPYGPEAPPENNTYSNDDADYQGGPTVFDRRGSGERSYIPPVKDAAPAHEPERSEAHDVDTLLESAPQTTLVFKDGHQLEVGKYAIIGATLFDLTPGHTRKIPVADLNLEATTKQNEDRGVVFQLPPSLRTN